MRESDVIDQDEDEEAPQPAKEDTGLIRRPSNALAPSSLAEQQRAIAEVQAMLTVAQRCPRDEAECLDRIITTCQRLRVAEQSAYEYSRGGTNITGPSIKMMEVIAQQWGNVDFGFRELARYPGDAKNPGESVVEAYAWDCQSNTRRRVTFTVSHAMVANKKTKILTDPRDIYEHVANHAQRRVRTCLENIIPRDIVDEALDECDKTLRTKQPLTEENIKKLLEAFKKHGVSKDQIEARLQRRLEHITPAQYASLVRIGKTLSDGMSTIEDWFKPAATAKTKESPLTKPAGGKKAESTNTEPPGDADQPASPGQTNTPEGSSKPAEEHDKYLDLRNEFAECKTLRDCEESFENNDNGDPMIAQLRDEAMQRIRNSRGPRSNKGGKEELFDKGSPNAQE